MAGGGTPARRQPFHPTARRKFNPLQQVTYLVAMHVAMSFMAISGLILLLSATSPDQLVGGPGTEFGSTGHFLGGPSSSCSWSATSI
jgi:thiosulfate reductase cytochrome b subunit